jgi:hypothetical protein
MPPGGFLLEFAIPRPGQSFRSGGVSKSPLSQPCFDFGLQVPSAAWRGIRIDRPTCRGRARRDDRLNRPSLLLERRWYEWIVLLQGYRGFPFFQLSQCLAVAGAFGQHFTPEFLGLGMIAALGGDRCQIAPGQMSVNALIDAAKLIGPLAA